MKVSDGASMHFVFLLPPVGLIVQFQAGDAASPDTVEQLHILLTSKTLYSPQV